MYSVSRKERRIWNSHRRFCSRWRHSVLLFFFTVIIEVSHWYVVLWFSVIVCVVSRRNVTVRNTVFPLVKIHHQKSEPNALTVRKLRTILGYRNAPNESEPSVGWPGTLKNVVRHTRRETIVLLRKREVPGHTNLVARSLNPPILIKRPFHVWGFFLRIGIWSRVYRNNVWDVRLDFWQEILRVLDGLDRPIVWSDDGRLHRPRASRRGGGRSYERYCFSCANLNFRR